MIEGSSGIGRERKYRLESENVHSTGHDNDNGTVSLFLHYAISCSIVSHGRLVHHLVYRPLDASVAS